MSDDSQPPTTTAKAPFDDANADIVFRTSDNVDFCVFRLILSLSSSFFQGMFALPQPQDNANVHINGQVKPPRIDVPEDSQTLDILLRLLYPNTNAPPFHDISHACNVAIAASKYNMSAALDRIADKVQAQYLTSHPLHVYFIACRVGWEGVAKAAAKNCHEIEADRSDEDSLVQSGILDYTGAGVAYHRLEIYRRVYRQTLEEKIENMSLFEDYAFCWQDCGCKEKVGDGGVSGRCLRQWIAYYIDNIKVAALDYPKKDALDDFFYPDSDCMQCSMVTINAIATARHEVDSQVKDTLSEVELRFGS